jgi:hypothetical protein
VTVRGIGYRMDRKPPIDAAEIASGKFG